MNKISQIVLLSGTIVFIHITDTKSNLVHILGVNSVSAREMGEKCEIYQDKGVDTVLTIECEKTYIDTEVEEKADNIIGEKLDELRRKNPSCKIITKRSHRGPVVITNKEIKCDPRKELIS